MKKLAVSLLALSLTGCQTASYQQYADAAALIARYRAEAQAANAAAIATLAHYGDATTKTVAVIMLGLRAEQRDSVNVQPPQNEALQWAQVLLPTVATLGMGYWGYRLGQTQSNNAASVSIAGYQAMGGIADAGFNAVGQFKPQPFDWSGLAQLQPNVTTTTTLTNNAPGVIGSGRTDNSTTTNTTTNTDSSDRSITNPAPVIVTPIVLKP